MANNTKVGQDKNKNTINKTSSDKKTNTVQKLNENKAEKQEEQGGFMFGLTAFLVATMIMIFMVSLAFYFVIHNNYNGLGEKYRNNIQKIPLLSWALPKLPDSVDPAAMTDSQIREKYTVYKNKVVELTKSLDLSNKTIRDMQKYKDMVGKAQDASEKVINDLKAQQAQVDIDKKAVNVLKKTIDGLIAGSNKDAFKAYYEQIDSETAKALYATILKEQKLSDAATKFIQIYETMDSKATAKILEQFGDSKISLVVDILKNMKKDKSAEILAAMSATYASKVTEKLSKLFLK